MSTTTQQANSGTKTPFSPAAAPTQRPPDSFHPYDAQVSHLLLKTFLENIPDHVYFKDLQSRFLVVSQAKASRGNLQREDYLGKTDFDFFAEAHARAAFEDEQQIIRTGTPILEKLEKETWPDGHITWVVTSKLPLRDAEGKIVGTFGISKDVTDKMEMEKALEAANNQLIEATRQAGMAEVATGVLHNVGNVLTSINVTANLLSEFLRITKGI